MRSPTVTNSGASDRDITNRFADLLCRTLHMAEAIQHFMLGKYAIRRHQILA